MNKHKDYHKTEDSGSPFPQTIVGTSIYNVFTSAKLLGIWVKPGLFNKEESGPSPCLATRLSPPNLSAVLGFKPRVSSVLNSATKLHLQPILYVLIQLNGLPDGWVLGVYRVCLPSSGRAWKLFSNSTLISICPQIRSERPVSKRLACVWPLSLCISECLCFLSCYDHSHNNGYWRLGELLDGLLCGIRCVFISEIMC